MALLITQLERGHRLHEKAYESLREAIAQGVLRPGERVLETVLSRSLGVSRTPIREAIRRLSQEGWLTLLPNGGAIVKPISAREIIDAYTVRAVIEGLAAGLACRNATKARVDELHETIRASEATLDAGELEKTSALNAAYHNGIVRLSNNPRLVDVAEALQIYTVYYRRLVLEAAESPQGREAYMRHVRGRIEEHRRILEMITEGEAERVERLVRSHVSGNAANMVRLLGLVPGSELGQTTR